MSTTRKPRRKFLASHFEVVAGDLAQGERRDFPTLDEAVAFAGQNRAMARRIAVYSDGSEQVFPIITRGGEPTFLPPVWRY